MHHLLPIVYAAIAAIGNAMFALGQKKSVGCENGLLFVGLSALLAALLAFLCAPLMGAFDLGQAVKGHGQSIMLSGCGLFLTYLGFNILYARYGASQYVLYAVLSIITTTIVVGVLFLKEPINIYHKLAIIVSLAAVILFSIGQAKI
ncbi:MAG: EamA family transporter [Desulfobulbus sp.]|jgi:drug/metabolite transporter (DMT)-like permease|uniref:EamA family transporter n=1 Tax=Desulfobulbus sp. TaxID=895 RepID=UPI00284DFA0C|nr:EamA family transporter [Desulfobulbus sp.]MDR2550308.1 EamA family transporter [Desulfobulbus sp.]